MRRSVKLWLTILTLRWSNLVFVASYSGRPTLINFGGSLAHLRSSISSNLVLHFRVAIS
jgi:hypothetical protein